ncbi:hypothetical protein QLX08_001218 [Tetragonisca angustula]
MHLLRWSFTLLTFIGLLSPSAWKYSWKRVLYSVYTIVVLLLLFSFEIFLFLDLVINVDNQDDFSDNLYVTLVFFSSCCKSLMLLIYRGDIETLLDALLEEPFVPVNAQEDKIRMRFEEQIEWSSKAYTIVLDVYLVWLWADGYFAYKRGKLKFRVWTPYDYSSPLLLLLSFIHQILATIFSTNLNVVYDCFFSGIMLHIYSQFEILEHRMKNITTDENYSAKLCAHHHHRIYQFATMVNDNFKTITSMQFLISTGVMCFNLYRLSLMEINLKFLETVSYTLCLLMQIFYYCWYGNEVKLKSLEIPNAVLESNLWSLNENSNKILLLITRRALEPIEFTGCHIISMNLESFVMLLRTAYSAYNLLKQSNAG